jgi:hypothetical protein
MSPDWLAQLAPAHAPPPIPGWPLAPGWWCLAAIALSAPALAMFGWRRSAPGRRRALRRAASRELARIARQAADERALAQGIESLLRRHALAVDKGAGRPTTLSGRAWLAYVADNSRGAFSIELGHSLLLGTFGREVPPGRRDDWLAGARAFIRHAGRRAS